MGSCPTVGFGMVFTGSCPLTDFGLFIADEHGRSMAKVARRSGRGQILRRLDKMSRAIGMTVWPKCWIEAKICPLGIGPVAIFRLNR